MLTTRKAFTAIELLLVIGVLVILIAIVAWGLKGAGNAGSGKATQTTLANLTSMSEELNRKNKLAGFEGPPTENPIYPNPPGGVLAPGLVTADSKNSDRFTDTVRLTAEVMRRLQSIPDNKRILEKLPSDQLLAVPPGFFFAGGASAGGTVVLDGWKNPIIFVPTVGLREVTARSDQNGQGTWSNGMTYQAGARVTYPSTGGITKSPGLFYFTAKRSNTGVTPTDGDDWFQGIRAPDGRSFWASAGPDGAFGCPITGNPKANPQMASGGTGDDNIYSFDN